MANIQLPLISFGEKQASERQFVSITLHYHDGNVAVCLSTIRDETSQSPLYICTAQTAEPYKQLTNPKCITADFNSTGAFQKVKE